MSSRRTQSDLRSAVERRVKGALKVLGRRFGLRAISIRAEPTRDYAPRNRRNRRDMNPAQDNAIAAAYKFATAATLFEFNTHKKATISDLYLIHQQGTQGAEEHVNHPDSIAWKSMCATDEGKQKGEKWCKRAIWGNTLPEHASLAFRIVRPAAHYRNETGSLLGC